MSYNDKTLQCRDCSVSFSFTAGEQEFYASRGFDREPTRCPECRRARKAQRSDAGGGSGYRSEGYDSSDSYGGGGSGYGGQRRPREMHPAVCAQCGKDTEVPFLPRGDRPVYCSDCFAQTRQG